MCTCTLCVHLVSCHGGLIVVATLGHTLSLFVLCLWALLSGGVLCFLFVFSLLLCGLLHLVVIVRPMKREGVRGRTCRREFVFFPSSTVLGAAGRLPSHPCVRVSLIPCCIPWE